MSLSNWTIAEALMIVNILINLFVFMITVYRLKTDSIYHKSVNRLLFDIDVNSQHHNQ